MYGNRFCISRTAALFPGSFSMKNLQPNHVDSAHAWCSKAAEPVPFCLYEPCTILRNGSFCIEANAWGTEVHHRASEKVVRMSRDLECQSWGLGSMQKKPPFIKRKHHQTSRTILDSLSSNIKWPTHLIELIALCATKLLLPLSTSASTRQLLHQPNL